MSKTERAWIEGNRAAWAALLRTAVRELGDDVPDAARLVVQLEEVRRALRNVCAEHGDNDWPDNAHLGDVIEKHLGRHLDRGCRAGVHVVGDGVHLVGGGGGAGGTTATRDEPRGQCGGGGGGGGTSSG